jgi:signal transduction histidine kinase
MRPRDALVGQLLWLVDLRWLAIVGILAVALIARYVFAAITTVYPIYSCAAMLLVSNLVYVVAARRGNGWSRSTAAAWGMIQVEVDLVVLTLALYFAGGVNNPFVLFYVFHVIIAAIILPVRLSFSVGLTAIVLYGLLALNELTRGRWLGHHPLEFVTAPGLWGNPAYVLGACAAFGCTVLLAQYLTRVIISRMTAKELEAAHNHDVLQAVIRAMNEGLVLIDPEGQILLCNPSALAWRAGPAGPESLTLDQLPRELARYVRRMVSANGSLTDQDGVRFETDAPQPRTIEARGCCVRDPGARTLGYAIVGKDVTDHRQLEKELTDRTEQVTAINEMLKMSRVQMAQREKMVAIGQMAAGIAHEIGNPLASLSSVVQYLARTPRPDEEKHQLSVVLGHVNRISEILKRMLTFARPATSEYRWSDIDALIENTLLLIKYDKRMQSVVIKNVREGELPTLWMNPQSFEQILLNVFINALDAMSARQDTQDHVLEIVRSCENETVRIRIRDTGIGMSQEVADRAFDSFFTTKDIGKGTGLGLFITRNLITELDGSIRLESELGRGTSVIIQLPVRPRAALLVGRGQDVRGGATTDVR